MCNFMEKLPRRKTKYPMTDACRDCQLLEGKKYVGVKWVRENKFV